MKTLLLGLAMLGAAAATFAEEIMRPELKPGSRFEYAVYDGYSHQEVQHLVFVFRAMKGGKYQFTLCENQQNPCQSPRDADFNRYIADPATGKAKVIPLFFWPLREGGRMPFEFQLGNEAFKGEVMVKGQESVKVKAGEFMAYKLVRKGQWSFDSYSGPFEETTWYAPAIGHIVKSEYSDFNSKGGRFNWQQTELVDYRAAP